MKLPSLKIRNLEAKLKQARLAKAGRRWKDVFDFANEALIIDSTNQEAKQLQIDAKAGIKADALETSIRFAVASTCNFDGIRLRLDVNAYVTLARFRNDEATFYILFGADHSALIPVLAHHTC